MRKALCTAAATAALLTGCGGEREPMSFSPTGCVMQVRGAVNEDLFCVAALADFGPGDITHAVQVDGFALASGSKTVGTVVWLSSAPAVNTSYGWSATGANVVDGWAVRAVGDLETGFAETTHEATPAWYDDPAVGSLSLRLSAIPATDVMSGAPVHGVLDATLPSTTAGGAVTVHAEF